MLGIARQQVRCYTESEAPYYYISKKDVFKSVSSVAVIDIGGGSTDMVYLKMEVLSWRTLSISAAMSYGEMVIINL